jgi:hypothetical protein
LHVAHAQAPCLRNFDNQRTVKFKCLVLGCDANPNVALMKIQPSTARFSFFQSAL